MSRDEIYKELPGDRDFRFDATVAAVFDDMLDRSVPGYRQVIEMSGAILARYLTPGDLIYDLGCSTGTTLLELASRLPQPGLRFIGLDNSPAMLAKARDKAKDSRQASQLEFREADITTAPLEAAGAVLMNYTLQFIAPACRQDFLHTIYQTLRPGGVLILSEKTIAVDPKLDQAYLEFYLDFKRANGYSESEIARKRQALEKVLIPFSLADNLRMLAAAGFSQAEPFHQWFNFASLVAVKE
ncbi:MAG: carboxy-S-adenosyl-L-methionine synthase CmoA [Desulfobulbaceae bacterium]|nr:carboxy-S-adenosyl-L-methionine synthase CmoA [Desulfobulbaceae bacterium]